MLDSGHEIGNEIIYSRKDHGHNIEEIKKIEGYRVQSITNKTTCGAKIYDITDSDAGVWYCVVTMLTKNGEYVDVLEQTEIIINARTIPDQGDGLSTLKKSLNGLEKEGGSVMNNNQAILSSIRVLSQAFILCLIHFQRYM